MQDTTLRISLRKIYFQEIAFSIFAKHVLPKFLLKELKTTRQHLRTSRINQAQHKPTQPYNSECH